MNGIMISKAFLDIKFKEEISPMDNINETAKKLADDFKNTKEFKDLHEALENVKRDATSSALYREMNSLQGQIMDAQQHGRDLTEDMRTKYEDLNKRLQDNEQMKTLIKAEEKVYSKLDEVQKTLTKPMADLYEKLRDHK